MSEENAIPPTTGAAIRVTAPWVYIIESPRADEILDGNLEGKALARALRLAQFKCDYLQVVNAKMLEEAFCRIGIESRVNQDEDDAALYFPVVHISAHGAQDGFDLTSGESVLWPTLGKYLYQLKEVRELSPDEPARTILSLATCSGLFGSQAAQPQARAPFDFVIGPQETVSRQDSLTAWITFYHLLLHKDRQLRWCIEMMNSAAGLKPMTFAMISGKAMEEFLKKSSSTDSIE